MRRPGRRGRRRRPGLGCRDCVEERALSRTAPGSLLRMPPDRPRAVAEPQRDSRVLVFSQRSLHTPVWHSAQYELEDLLATFDDVDLVAPPSHPHAALSRASRHVVNGALRRVGGTRRSPPWDIASMQRTRVEADHDLFFAVFHHSFQISYLNRLEDWRKRCRTAACVLVEAWSPSFAEDEDYLRLLAEFDVVYVFNPRTIPLLTALGVPDVRPLPLAVDAAAFSPLPLLPARVLDCYSYGRSSQMTHAALLQAVERDGLTYVYDTLRGGVLADSRQHRSLVANLMKRAQFFLAYRINDSAERRARTGGDEALSTRYFEGAAGGAVMIGSSPEAPEFAECFDWPDAVLPVPYDSTDIADVLADLRRQPDRLARIRADNVRNSLLRHDWVHRWASVLADVGLPATAEMESRRSALQALSADAVPQAFLT